MAGEITGIKLNNENIIRKIDYDALANKPIENPNEDEMDNHLLVSTQDGTRWKTIDEIQEPSFLPTLPSDRFGNPISGQYILQVDGNSLSWFESPILNIDATPERGSTLVTSSSTSSWNCHWEVLVPEYLGNGDQDYLLCHGSNGRSWIPSSNIVESILGSYSLAPNGSALLTDNAVEVLSNNSGSLSWKTIEPLPALTVQHEGLILTTTANGQVTWDTLTSENFEDDDTIGENIIYGITRDSNGEVRWTTFSIEDLISDSPTVVNPSDATLLTVSGCGSDPTLIWTTFSAILKDAAGNGCPPGSCLINTDGSGALSWGGLSIPEGGNANDVLCMGPDGVPYWTSIDNIISN